MWNSPKGESSPKVMLTIVWNRHGFHVVDLLLMGSKSNRGHYISHILLSLREIVILPPYQDDTRWHKMTQGDILWFTLTMPDLTGPKRLLYCFGSQFPTPSASSSLLTMYGPLKLLAFRRSERNASGELIRRTWWTLLR
jgi:hypothetical protein